MKVFQPPITANVDVIASFNEVCNKLVNVFAIFSS